MKNRRFIVLIVSLACLITGYVWNAKDTFQMEIEGDNYIISYQFVFLSLAILLALAFLLTTLIKLFKR